MHFIWLYLGREALEERFAEIRVSNGMDAPIHNRIVVPE